MQPIYRKGFNDLFIAIDYVRGGHTFHVMGRKMAAKNLAGTKMSQKMLGGQSLTFSKIQWSQYIPLSNFSKKIKGHLKMSWRAFFCPRAVVWPPLVYVMVKWLPQLAAILEDPGSDHFSTSFHLSFYSRVRDLINSSEQKAALIYSPNYKFFMSCFQL